MNTGKLGSFLPLQSIALLILCGLGVLAFLALVIWPAQRYSAELDREITSMKARIEEQQLLLPLFKSLAEKTKAVNVENLPSPVRTKLKRSEIPMLPTRQIQELAAEHRLGVREITPDINTISDASGKLLLHVTAGGEFVDLRGFLISLAALPYFKSIEQIDIRAVEGGEEFGLNIWLAKE